MRDANFGSEEHWPVNIFLLDLIRFRFQLYRAWGTSTWLYLYSTQYCNIKYWIYDFPWGNLLLTKPPKFNESNKYFSQTLKILRFWPEGCWPVFFEWGKLIYTMSVKLIQTWWLFREKWFLFKTLLLPEKK